MWMSNIKKYLQELDRTPVLNAVFMLSMFCIALVFIFAVINGVKQILGLDSAEKIIAVISGSATTLTLLFLVYQHYYNSSKNYQITISEEVKLIITKMEEQIELLHRSGVNNIQMLSGFLIEMTNHIIDVDSLYDEVNDPALNKILRIRWQDMYHNHYDGVMKNIDVCSIIRDNSYWNDYAESSLVLIKGNAIVASQGKINEEYEIALHCLSEAKKTGLCDLSDKIDSYMAFKKYFLEREYMNKYMGYDHSIYRNEYPSLCALVELYTNN